MADESVSRVSARELGRLARGQAECRQAGPVGSDVGAEAELDMAAPYLSAAVSAGSVWASVPRGAKAHALRQAVLKIIRPSSAGQERIDESQTAALVLLLEANRSMTERIQALEERVHELERASS